MSTPEHDPRPTFAPDQFTTLRGGHGATKLASSAVAPLVAAARGYETVTPGEVKEAASRHRLGTLNSKHARKLKTNVGTEDAMIMPWYRLDISLGASANGKVAAASTVQLRPSRPLQPSRPGGDPRKYDMLEGVGTELDVHPSTPADWNTTAPLVFFTEGLIKGDAALTGLLRAAGISDDELAQTHEGGDPARELRTLMEQVPVAERALVVSFASVTTWRNRHEWTALEFKGRQAWVGFDADAGENYQVWSQANQLIGYLETRDMARVSMLDLGRTSPEAARRKVGIDDFLAELGRWEDLPRALTDLPERPMGQDEGEAGQWRVTKDGRATEEAVATKHPDGSTGPAVWVPRVPIGGRVARVESMRQPTRAEMETGRLETGHEDLEARVEVELRWADPVTGQDQSTRVTGPAVILAYPPRDWDRKGAQLPGNLLRHPEWPPDKGLEWLRAVKKHRLEEVVTNTRWKSMGWVPSEDGLPAYIAGNTVVTESGLTTDSSLVGVSDELLSGASSFGVSPPPDGEDWMDQARADLEAVIDTYIDSGAWTDPCMSATVLGIALRPAVPVLPRVVAYFVGPRRSGKSFTASHCISFWQPYPGTWGDDRLPGSAKDTIASMEHSVAHANIWVSDDLAPSTDRFQASREEAAMGDLIRSIHNGVGKRRMNADMTAREVNHPRAVLVVTAENEPSVSSVGDRMIVLHFGDGVLAPSRAVTDRLVRMRDVTGEPARLAQAFVRWHLWKARQMEGGWPAMMMQVRAELATCQNYAAAVLSGEGKDGTTSRHAVMAADVMITLARLSQMAKDLGADPRTIGRLQMAGLPTQVALQVARAHDAQRLTSPGRRVVQAVSLLLSANQAHVASLEDPNAPPVSDQSAADLVNRRLGWLKTGGEVRPCGSRIGWLTTGRDRTTEVVLLDPEVAFAEAHRRHPNLLPHGQKPTTAWASAWDEHLTVPLRGADGRPLGWRRHSNGRSLQHVVRVTSGGQVVSGVPVLLSTLLNGVETDDDGDDEEPEDGHDLPGLRAVA